MNVKDMQEFLLSITAVVAPILAFLPDKTIDDQEVKQRIAFDGAGQDITDGPYLVFSGPFAYDTGLFSGGACGTKKADFWLSCYTDYPDNAYYWATAIEEELIAYFTNVPPQPFFTGQEGTRFTSWLQKQGSLRKLPQDQVGQTSEESPRAGYTQGFQVGWQ